MTVKYCLVRSTLAVDHLFLRNDYKGRIVLEEGMTIYSFKLRNVLCRSVSQIVRSNYGLFFLHLYRTTILRNLKHWHL